ncbi:AvrD family protein [Actinophytocola xanthii]|uniref:Avirulence D protein (AvrD) n=1 Tax=Actinophytocola xanthii TaxID=1912961 RepID=A0A1Q8CSC7_9PSEU|nr:AvrD family protein [Actinophytocola xanthii]OLF17258.1 hypothetical protein BU204_12790 [Actinophytocola xanthii]
MTELRCESIDDYLGPAEGRFFGSGYRRARHEVGEVVVGADSGTRSTVDVHYPANWSRKGDEADLRPHLSTVDMLVLGVQLSEAHLAHGLGLSPAQRARSWVRTVTLRAGTTPQEDLTGLGGTAMPRGTRAVSDTESVTTYDCAVGAMRARCELQHPAGTGAHRGSRFDSLDDALGPADTRYYGAGLATRTHRITDVQVDLARLRARADLRLDPVVVNGGVDGAYQPGVSLVDAFVADLQLAQVMMYELDSVRRQDSNTLWMLRTTLEATDPHRPCAGPVECRAAITGKRLLPLRGGTWRTVDIEGECGGVSLRAAFAHELPAHLRAEEAS